MQPASRHRTEEKALKLARLEGLNQGASTVPTS